MKIKYTARKNKRINHGFLWILTLEPDENNLLYNCYTKQLEPSPLYVGPCLTVKSFRRKLKRFPFGVKFELVSLDPGVESVIGTGTKR